MMIELEIWVESREVDLFYCPIVIRACLCNCFSMEMLWKSVAFFCTFIFPHLMKMLFSKEKDKRQYIFLGFCGKASSMGGSFFSCGKSGATQIWHVCVAKEENPFLGGFCGKNSFQSTIGLAFLWNRKKMNCFLGFFSWKSAHTQRG